jgi:hypothetical protein
MLLLFCAALASISTIDAQEALSYSPACESTGSVVSHHHVPTTTHNEKRGVVYMCNFLPGALYAEVGLYKLTT